MQSESSNWHFLITFGEKTQNKHTSLYFDFFSYFLLTLRLLRATIVVLGPLALLAEP